MPTKSPTKKKKSRKMDGKLISKDNYELDYEARKMKTSRKKVKAAKKVVGRSRKKIEKKLNQE